ncbi:ATP-binding protein [Acidithiobacillus ferriphilus]|uniref:AAA-like domain-containing protein n=1 Tax=Acidithiobacillus ferriphilus TaxID=1689834 RepID=UPI001C067E6C|nr:ATP-binding protein [Acidithiobacillus ferriphilus]MBU2847613.1 ATP-binding protein [Acidithiobacillus ferriphilus]
MAINEEARTRFFSEHPEQQKLAEALDEAFDVTFGNQYGGQFLWLCKPKNGVAERFGLQKEIIAIYSAHNKIDARTFTNLENISLSRDFKHRVDKVVVMVIHEDDTESADELLSQTNDWVIISVHANELRDKNRGPFFLRAKLAGRIGSFDLFGMSSPIKDDKYFYGRDPLVQEVIQRISVRKENSGIFGLRKTGKTSVLFALQRRLYDKDVLAEYIDCQSPGIYGARWWQLLHELASRLRQTISDKFGVKIDDDSNYDKDNAANSFNHFLKRITTFQDRRQIVLLFDEIEFITPGISNSLGQHWDEDFLPFWQTIRSTSQELDGSIIFIVAGVNPSSVEQSHIGQIPNPIFQLAVPYYLEPLTRQDVRHMVRSIGKYSGFSFDERVYDYLQETYGGHPYLIRLACSEVARSKGEVPIESKVNITGLDFESRSGVIRSRLSQPIKDILLSLVWWYPDEYDLLLLLASGDTGFVLDYLKDTPEKAVQFVRYGLVRQYSGVFAIRDLREFLNVHGESYKNVISPFKRGDLPLDVLPERPDLSDLSILFEKRTEIEVGLRKYILMVLGFKFGFDDKLISGHIAKSLRNNRADKSQLFVGRRPQDAINELFLSDLKPIFVSNWSEFSPIFDNKLQRFEMNMDTINLARRFDAHAKPVRPVDKDEFLNSYSWFRSRLAKVPNLM